MKKTSDISKINSTNMDIKPRLFPYTVLQLEDNHQEKEEEDTGLDKLDEILNLNEEEIIINNNGNTHEEAGKVKDPNLKPLEGLQNTNKNNEQILNNDDQEFKLQEIHVEIPPYNPFGKSQKDGEDLVSLGIQLSEYEQQIKAEKASSQKQLMDLKQLLNTFDNIKVVKKDNNPNAMLSLAEGFSKGKIIEFDINLAYKATKEPKQPKGFFQFLLGKATRYLILQHRVLLICQKESKKNTFSIRNVCPLTELFQIYNDKDSEHIRLYFINKMKTAQLLPRCKEFDVKNKPGFLVELREQINNLGFDFSFQKL